MAPKKLILDYVYEKESAFADRVYLTQPVGGGKVIDYTWRQVLDEARRMAAHLQRLGLQPGDRVAMLSKNCAHFFMAELAIWMGGSRPSRSSRRRRPTPSPTSSSTARRRRSSSGSSTPDGRRSSRVSPMGCTV